LVTSITAPLIKQPTTIFNDSSLLPWTLLGSRPRLRRQTQTLPAFRKGNLQGPAVPAGYIAFTPDVGNGGRGSIKVLQIKDGIYDSSKEPPDQALVPGPYLLRIAGFDGKTIPLWGQGKQIFNPVDDTYVVPEGVSTKDFTVPDSAGENVKILPTADI
jgi:hypothetical protein